jgi:hypothetical protein
MRQAMADPVSLIKRLNNWGYFSERKAGTSGILSSAALMEAKTIVMAAPQIRGNDIGLQNCTATRRGAG